MRQPRENDFLLIAGELGLSGFPPDYVELARGYPAMEIDGFLRIWLPDPGDEAGYADHLRDELELVQELAEDGLTSGHEAHPAPGGLLA